MSYSLAGPRRKKPGKPWRRWVTVCIVGICNYQRTIVSVSDMMLSLGDAAADRLVRKVDPLCTGWFVMYSTDNIDRVEPILRSVQTRLEGRTDYTVDVLKDAFASVCQAEVARERKERVLDQLGWSLETFTSHGRERLGPVEFQRWMRKFRRISTECDFLVHGFDPEGRPRIFRVDSLGWIPGEATVAGYEAIGSGGASATNSLMYHGYHAGLPEREAVYRIFEAKFFAESEGGVGRATLFTIARSDGRWAWLVWQQRIDVVRDIVEAGKHPAPELFERVGAFLEGLPWGSR